MKNTTNKGCANETYHIFFRKLANPLKIDIIIALRENEKGKSVSDITKELGVEQSKVSHALHSLNCCSIVNVNKKGKQRIYSLNNETIVPMLKILDKHRCKYCKEKMKDELNSLNKNKK